MHYGSLGGDGRVHRKSGRDREWLGRPHGSKGGVGRPLGSPGGVRRAPGSPVGVGRETRKSRRGRESNRKLGRVRECPAEVQ